MDEHVLPSSLGIRMARSIIYRLADDKSISKELLINISESLSKATKAEVRDAPVHRRTYITERRFQEHGDNPKCAGRVDDHKEAYSQRFDDIAVVEVEAAARGTSTSTFD